jgi:hypothetical protein
MAAAKLKRFDLSFRTAYAQAKEAALAQSNVSLLTPGSIQHEVRGGSKFVYRYRYDAAGKRIAQYLGPESGDDGHAALQAAKDEIRSGAIFAQYSRDLRRVGFYGADNSTVVTVAQLFNTGIFSGGGVLVGSHAFGAILNELGYSTAFPLTEDVDIARGRRIQIAALPEGGFLAVLRETGLPFQEVPELERGGPPTSFKVRGRMLKVDLLVPAKGAPDRSIRVPKLGAHATGLPFLDYLIADPMQSILLGRDRIVPIVVPNAGRYCIHKLAVYAMRSTSQIAKRDKDVFHAATLAAVLAPEQDVVLVDAVEAMNKTIRAKARAGARRALEWLGGDPPEAVEV